jgi:enoyl-CoA hydratase/carnithine racemase
MTKTEKFLAVAVSITAGIAIAYIQKSKQLERLNSIQAETIKELREYIEWAESDHSKIYTRRIDE